MTLLSVFNWIGRHSRPILPLGLVLLALLPASNGRLAPLLPWLVGALIAMTFTRIDLGPLLADMIHPRRAGRLIVLVALFQPGLALLLSEAGRGLGLPPEALLAIVVFAAAPPLSSAPAIALMLGYDARLALRMMLTGTLLSPLTIPVSFWMAGLTGGLPLDLALRTATMLGGGLVAGLLLRRLFGPARIMAQARALDGMATTLMLLFLLPVVDGLLARILATPRLALEFVALACLLNFGGNLLMRAVAQTRFAPQVAATAGLVFGNRNVSVVLAALPDPTIAFFVGLAQVPIYLTPFLLGIYDRIWSRCSLSSES